MNEPLGYTIGNSLEIIESINVMKGIYVPQVTELTVRMAARLMVSFDMAKSIEEGEKKALEVLESGKALEKFKKTVEMQGGDPNSIDNAALLPRSREKKQVICLESGYINSIDALQFGKALVQLGGGRMRKEDDVDHAVGFVLNKKVGDKIEKGEILYTIHYNDENKLKNAEDYLGRAIEINEEKKETPPLILDEM